MHNVNVLQCDLDPPASDIKQRIVMIIISRKHEVMDPTRSWNTQITLKHTQARTHTLTGFTLCLSMAGSYKSESLSLKYL